MKKSIFGLGVFMLFFLLLLSFTIKEVEPEVEFSTMTVDYGTVKYNSNPIRILTVNNKGDEPLIIKRIRVSGGGLAPASYPKEPIIPQEKGEIKVRYNTKKIGVFNKTMMVETNTGTHIIKVKGTVLDSLLPKIEAETNIVNYDTITENSNPYRYFTFKNTGNAPLRILNVKSSGGCMVNYSKEPIEPNETGVIKIRYNTKRLGSFNRQVTVITNAEKNPYMFLVKGFVRLRTMNEIKQDSIRRIELIKEE